MKDRSKRAGLHPMLLLIIVVCICAVLTYIIPAGNYENETIREGIGTVMVDPDSFVYQERTPATVLEILTAPTMGAQASAGVIFYLLIVGGMFSIISGTGALNIALANLLRLAKGKDLLLIPAFMLIFGCGATFCGNFEEFLVLVPIVLAVCMTAGFDSLTAVGVIFISATAGYAGAVTNAFTLGTAQEIAGVELFAGMPFRAVLFGVLIVISIAYVMWHANMVRKNPRISSVYEIDKEYNYGKKLNLEDLPHLTPRQGLVLVVLLIGMAFAIFGIIVFGFYVDELAAVFLTTGIVAGIVGGLRLSEICEKFLSGCHDMVFPSVMIALASAAVWVLERASVMDTILHTLAGLLNNLPTRLLPCGMFVIHEIFNVFVPSGSAQAHATIPLMLALADRAHISRQVAILAYHLGDAFTNILAPTGGEILAALAIGRVPFGKWVKYLAPLFIVWWITAFVFLVIAVRIGY